MNQTKITGIPDEPTVAGRRKQGGVATSDVVMSATVGGNADVFPDILDLHVPKGSLVADVTWGKGVFWKNVPPDDYRLLATDLQTGVDATALPYEDASLDALILDPPYMEGLFRKDTAHMAGGGSHAAFRQNYSNGKTTNGSGPTLPRTTWKKYAEEDRAYLLKTLVDITWPLQDPWTTDLLGLLDGAPDLGEVVEADTDEATIRLPGTDEIAHITD